MKKQALWYAAAAALLLNAAVPAAYARSLAVGDLFPAVTTAHRLTEEERTYFAIAQGPLAFLLPRHVSISDIQADLIVMEFLNTCCSSCQAQAPILNQAFRAVQRDQDLRGRVRFIGIGAGNDERDLERFARRFDVPFPLMPDPDFSWYDAAGAPDGTPYIIILKRQARDFWVIGTRLGLLTDSRYIVSSLRTASEKTIADLNRRVLEKDLTPGDERVLSLALSPARRLELVGRSMKNAGAAAPDIKLLQTGTGETLYTARVEIQGRALTLYSSILSEPPLCDISHGAHFIITFDEHGVIRDFYPVHLTKYGNVEWNDFDAENMRKQLVGKRLAGKLAFDPAIDAVTSATMSSSIIYRAAHQLSAIYKQLD